METLDEIDSGILAARATLRNRFPGPRVGDFIRMRDGSLRRFTHDWGDGIQVTCTGKGLGGGRFYLDNHGRADYSGALDPAIPTAKIAPTSETMLGAFWFFRHNSARAHNGVDVEAVCRVYREREAAHDPAA